MENDKLLHKWVNGTLSPEESEAFKQRPEYDALVALYKNTDDLQAPSFAEDQMLANILNTKKTAKVVTITDKKSFFRPWMGYAAAVALVAITALFLFNRSSEITYQLAKGERQEGILPDQSTFLLNAESTLTYDPKNWDKEREIKLNGEAFFQVEKGATFQVKTPNGIVQVLGTSFNVKARKDILDVYCKTGKVAVLTKGGKVIKELTPENAIRINNGKIIEEWTIPKSDNNSWVSGITKLRNVPLFAALNELERQFDIEIQTNGISTEEMVTCNFQHKDLELALKTTLTPLKIKYQILNEKEVSLQK